jgi:hypothetical protein
LLAAAMRNEGRESGFSCNTISAYDDDDGGKFDQNSVAGGFHDATAMERNGGIDQLTTKVSQALERTLLIQPSQ